MSIQIGAKELWKKALAFPRLEPTPPASQTRPKLPLSDRLMPVLTSGSSGDAGDGTIEQQDAVLGPAVFSLTVAICMTET